MPHPKLLPLVACLLGGSIVLATAGCGGMPKLDDKPDAVEAQGNLERSIAFLQTTYHDPRPEIRANCIEALQPLHDKRSTNIQEQGLHDPEWVVRFSAAMAIGKQKNMELKPSITQLIKTEPDASVQVAMVYALRRMGDASQMNLLGKSIHNPSPVVLLANTALVLGLLGERSAIVVLEAAKFDTDPRVKLELTAALARLGDPDAQNTILAMSFSYAEDSYTAINVAGDLDNPEVDNVLIRGLAMKDQLKNPTPQQRLVLTRGSLLAARALGKRHDGRGAQMALDYLKDPEPQLRALAAFALGEILNSRGEYHLVPLLSDPDIHVQIAAAAAIVNIGSHVQTVATQPIIMQKK